MLASLLVAFYRYPIRGLLIFGGVTLLAPVIFPVASLLVRPLVKPMTEFYLDLAEDVSEAIEERDQQKAAQAKKGKHKKDKDLSEAWEKTAILDEVIETI
jgi:hypothetical protein